MSIILELGRKNHQAKDINFVDGIATHTFTYPQIEDSVLTIKIHTETESPFLVNAVVFASRYTQGNKYVNRYMAEKMPFAEFADRYYDLQRRLKMAAKGELEKLGLAEPKTKKAEPVAEPVAEPKKAVKAEPLPEPKRETTFKPKATPKVGLEAQIFNMVAEGINDDSTTEIIIGKTKKFLDDHGIIPNQVEIVVKQENEAPVTVGAQHKEFKTILNTIAARVPIALVGPAGSGKTTTVKNVAEALNLKFFAKSVSAQTGQHEFFGYQDANGKYVTTLFREAYETGGVFLLDEFDAGNPNVLAALNQATANGETAFADGMVHKHDDFIIVMAGNTYGHGATSEYVGRNKIDAATLDRFAFIYFGYDEDLEARIATNQAWTKKVQKIRKAVEEKKIKTIISPRASIYGSKLLKAGLKEKQVLDMLIFKGLNNDERALLKSATR